MSERRVHLVLASEQHARYRAAAEREGLSMSAWLRAAADDRLGGEARRLDSVTELDAFFTACDEAEVATTEPDWHTLSDGDERVSSAGPTL